MFTFYSNLLKGKVHSIETEKSNNAQPQTPVVIQNHYYITNARNVIAGNNSSIIDFADNVVESHPNNEESNEESDEEEWEILEDGLFA